MLILPSCVVFDFTSEHFNMHEVNIVGLDGVNDGAAIFHNVSYILEDLAVDLGPGLDFFFLQKNMR